MQTHCQKWHHAGSEKMARNFAAPCTHAMGGSTHWILAIGFLIKLQVIQIGSGRLPFQAGSCFLARCGCWLHWMGLLFIQLWHHGRHGVISSWLWQHVIWQRLHIDPVANGIFTWNAIGGKHTLGVFCWIQLHYISMLVGENESFTHGAPVSMTWLWPMVTWLPKESGKKCQKLLSAKIGLL